MGTRGVRRICCFTRQPDKCVHAFNRIQKKVFFLLLLPVCYLKVLNGFMSAAVGECQAVLGILPWI